LRSSEVAYILRRLVSPIFDIEIACASSAVMLGSWEAHRLATAFALLLLGLLLGIWLRQARLRRRSDRRRRTIALGLCLAHGRRHGCYFTILHLRPAYPSG
jgi:hypothetical protein